MAFRWWVAVLNNCISTNVYGHFESFRFFNQEIALLAGLVPCPGGTVTIQATIDGLPITHVGDGMFSGCSSLTSVTIPDSVTFIGWDAFRDCTSLTSVVIGNSVTNIEGGAFFECTGLRAAYFQGNAPSVGSYLFDGLDNVTVYYLPSTKGWEDTYGGTPTALWTNPLLAAGSVRAEGNGFAFTITWAPNASLVVEACSDLASPS
jgi:hypothetical protein